MASSIQPPSPSVKTRFLIMSDTHGQDFLPIRQPQQHVDVAIHCGDLTEGSKLDEFRSTINLLKAINAPLKLVIAGNHDFTLDTPTFKQKVLHAGQPLEVEEVRKAYGDYGEARRLFTEAEKDGIHFLEEGTYQFVLASGAMLKVFASPYTPSLGDWGFQYRRTEPHEFVIPADVHLAITHGPPRGIMDYTESNQRAGCPGLFAAIARSRPRLHCFGHIHESWGAKLVTWKNRTLVSDLPSHFTHIDNDRSVVIEKLSGLQLSKIDDPEVREEKERKGERYASERCCSTSHSAENSTAHPLRPGSQTLFVNAALEGSDGRLSQFPWLVEIDLPRAAGDE